MDKEKEIEEIAKIVCDICFSAPHGIPCPEGLEKACSFANGEFTKSIAYMIERKADEVRKETLKVAYQNLYDMCKHGNFKNGKCGAKDILIWASEEGIGLDE